MNDLMFRRCESKKGKRLKEAIESDEKRLAWFLKDLYERPTMSDCTHIYNHYSIGKVVCSGLRYLYNIESST